MTTTGATLRDEGRTIWERLYGPVPRDWSFAPFGDLFRERREHSSDRVTYPLYSFTIEDGVTPKTERYERGFLLRDKVNNEFAVVHPGDFIFNPMNLRYGAISYSKLSFPVLVSGYYVVVIPDEDQFDSVFMECLLRSTPMMEMYDRIAIGSLVEKRRIHLSILRNVFLPIPPLAEQRGIATVLSAWDRGIRQVSSLIATKFRFKQGMVQQFLSGKRRFREYNGSDLCAAPLKEVFDKTADPIKVDPESTYREIGIRCHGKGIFHKEPVSGHSLGNKRVYPVVPGCLTLNIVFAWERALAVTTERESGMIASHRFPMFRPNRERLLPEYALLYLLSQKGAEALQLASPGGAGRNRTLSQTELLKTTIPLPTIAEQRKIVDFVETADREIEHLRNQLNALKEQKKGLMQKLLTGQVRVKS